MNRFLAQLSEELEVMAAGGLEVTPLVELKLQLMPIGQFALPNEIRSAHRRLPSNENAAIKRSSFC